MTRTRTSSMSCCDKKARMVSRSEVQRWMMSPVCTRMCHSKGSRCVKAKSLSRKFLTGFPPRRGRYGICAGNWSGPRARKGDGHGGGNPKVASQHLSWRIFVEPVDKKGRKVVRIAVNNRIDGHFDDLRGQKGKNGGEHRGSQGREQQPAIAGGILRKKERVDFFVVALSS